MLMEVRSTISIGSEFIPGHTGHPPNSTPFRRSAIGSDGSRHPSRGHMLRIRAVLPYGLAMLSCLSLSGWAATPCSRPLLFAANDTGQMIVVEDGKRIGGMVPDLLAHPEIAEACPVKFDEFPRMRAMRMFVEGHADLAWGAQTEERDQVGDFVSLFSTYPSLITTDPRLKNSSVEALLNDRKIVFNIVRGYAYGKEYDKLIAALRAQGRIEEVGYVELIARKLVGGHGSATILTTTTFVMAASKQHIGEQLVARPMVQLNKVKLGIYLSRLTMTDADRTRLKALIGARLKAGNLVQMMEARTPAWAMAGVEVSTQP